VTLAALAPGEWRVIPLGTDQRERIVTVARAAVSESESESVQALARSVLDRVGSDPLALASVALRLVQSLGRAPDPPGSDVLAGPLAVLDRGKGDCLTLSGLLLALCLALGLRVLMARITRPCDPDDHVCLVILLDGAFVWADPAGKLPLGGVDSGVPCPLPALAEIV